MTLKAKVRRVTGAVRHYTGVVREGAIMRGDILPSPAFVEIVEVEGGFLLLQLDNNNVYITDSWQPTIEDAKEQARDEFDINAEDWFECSE